MRQSKNRIYDEKTIGTEQNVYPKNKRWQVDYDYLEKLKVLSQGTCEKAKEARAALEYLSKFSSEYYDGNVKKDDKSALHHSEELRRDCYSKNNRQNRDLLSIRKAVPIHEIQLAEQNDD